MVKGGTLCRSRETCIVATLHSDFKCCCGALAGHPGSDCTRGSCCSFNYGCELCRGIDNVWKLVHQCHWNGIIALFWPWFGCLWDAYHWLPHVMQWLSLWCIQLGEWRVCHVELTCHHSIGRWSRAQCRFWRSYVHTCCRHCLTNCGPSDNFNPDICWQVIQIDMGFMIQMSKKKTPSHLLLFLANFHGTPSPGA